MESVKEQVSNVIQQDNFGELDSITVVSKVSWTMADGIDTILDPIRFMCWEKVQEIIDEIC